MVLPRHRPRNQANKEDRVDKIEQAGKYGENVRGREVCRARDMLGGGDTLRDNTRIACVVVRSLMTQLLPETQQLCAITKKTAVCAVFKFHVKECHNRRPIFYFFPNFAIAETASRSLILCLFLLFRSVLCGILSKVVHGYDVCTVRNLGLLFRFETCIVHSRGIAPLQMGTEDLSNCISAGCHADMNYSVAF